MNAWKQFLLTGYYWSSLLWRQRMGAAAAARGAAPIRILFYHRVADSHPNDWTISTRTFARHVRWLRRRFDLVTLHEAQRRIASGHNDRPTACITFDDGYADNLHFALPFLAKYEIPYTYFVSTDFVLTGEPFPHDAAAGIPLVPNSPGQLRRLAAAGAEIGAHTRSHANLGDDIPVDDLVAEIQGCKFELEDMIGRRVRYFAFPYGQKENLSEAAFHIAAAAGYEGVCSAYGGYNFPGDDSFHLRRFHADREFVRFKNWLTVDPRKVSAQLDFNPGNYQTSALFPLADANSANTRPPAVRDPQLSKVADER
jgi:peptidoglycan/xylan/chitin deacetylase (PgdA/CDA1 family)